MQSPYFKSGFIGIVVFIFFILDLYFVKRFSEKRQSIKTKDNLYTIFSVFIGLVLISQPILLPQLTWYLWGLDPSSTLLGVSFCLASLLIFLWSRNHLKEFYSEGAILLEEHRVIQTGPYKYVRHPIFTSFFLMSFGIFFVAPSIISFSLLIYTILDFHRAAKRDEELLLSTLTDYQEYMKKTARYFPKVFDFMKIVENLEELASRIAGIDEIKDIDRRRGRILSVLLLATGTSAVLGIFFTIFYDISNLANEPFGWLYSTFGAIILVALLLLVVNQWNQKWASWIFVIFLSLVVPLSDTPEEVVSGRSLFFFVFPVLIASFVLPPASSIYIAILDSAILIILTVYYGLEEINYIAMIGLFTISFVSWLISRILENSISETIKINQELDQRVVLRTQELEDAIEKLQELDRLKSKFVSDVSHELRTPISNLTIYLDMLQSNSTLGEVGDSKYISILKEETERITKLVVDILDLSRLEAKREIMEEEDIDLTEIISRTRSPLEFHAENAIVQHKFHLEKGINKILGNKDQIIQIINHLIINAINYSPNGAVRVATRNIDDNKVVFEVSDNGVGISEEDLDHIFERFYRGENVSQSTIPGTGLGLAITKELIELNNGEIQVNSELNKGSCFKVIFPAIQLHNGIRL